MTATNPVAAPGAQAALPRSARCSLGIRRPEQHLTVGVEGPATKGASRSAWFLGPPSVAIRCGGCCIALSERDEPRSVSGPQSKYLTC